MQTFVPEGANFELTAKELDYRRLGKQRVETWQILLTLQGTSKGWANHPAVKMWKGYETTLTMYGIAMCLEWGNRGYTDNMLDRFLRHLGTLGGRLIYPDWIDDEDLVLSHRSNLIRKFPEHYKPLWAGVPDDLPYVWPV